MTQTCDSPDATRLRPSDMDRDTFLAAFGDVYEHSPWIAARAHFAGPRDGLNTAAGLHAALATQFRAATVAEKLAVLTTHPDLAGTLAQAGRLTDASAAEQVAAGLGALSDAEHAEFTRLNAAYTARFGFPFIIAVRGRTAAGLLSEFRRRLRHDRATEIAEACAQVERIAELRIKAITAA